VQLFLVLLIGFDNPKLKYIKKKINGGKNKMKFIKKKINLIREKIKSIKKRINENKQLILLIIKVVRYTIITSYCVYYIYMSYFI
jgi:hypothetical protein